MIFCRLPTAKTEVGAPTVGGGGGGNIRFLSNVLKNCMKLKEFGPPPGGARVPRAPWIRHCMLSIGASIYGIPRTQAPTHQNFLNFMRAVLLNFFFLPAQKPSIRPCLLHTNNNIESA